SLKVIAPDGTEIPIKSQFKKMKEGQFDIKLLSGRYGKPGMYTIKTTLVKNGKTYDTQSQYAWGLVSLNTEKSIYHPGQTANMTIVVLDSGGHPVCDANILLNVKDPNSQTTSLSSANGITTGSECGLYNAQYVTSTQGNYTVNVTATADSIKTDFSTSFLVQNNFAFDIIRTAQSKIDPITHPNSFDVKIDVTSLVNQNNVIIKESIPYVFDVKTDANVKIIGDTKVITWNKSLIGNKTSIQYSYSVPLVFPQLYSLGPVEIDYGNQKFTEARQWFVAVDPNADTVIFSNNALASDIGIPANTVVAQYSTTSGATPNLDICLSANAGTTDDLGNTCSGKLGTAVQVSPSGTAAAGNIIWLSPVPSTGSPSYTRTCTSISNSGFTTGPGTACNVSSAYTISKNSPVATTTSVYSIHAQQI